MYFIAAFMNIKRGKEGERQLLIIIPLPAARVEKKEINHYCPKQIERGSGVKGGGVANLLPHTRSGPPLSFCYFLVCMYVCV